jgi:hypothetical protein
MYEIKFRKVVFEQIPVSWVRKCSIMLRGIDDVLRRLSTNLTKHRSLWAPLIADDPSTLQTDWQAKRRDIELNTPDSCLAGTGSK